MELVKRHILHSTQPNDIVLDCFCGSGTTCVACEETGRRFIGMEINKKYCRELGNKVITEISRAVQEDLSSEYVFVRYMGPKFVIAFSGVETNSVADYLNEMKDKIESMKIQLTQEEMQELNLDVARRNKSMQEKGEVAVPRINIVISSYYKGTALEEVLKKLEEYLDNAPINESDITNI